MGSVRQYTRRAFCLSGSIVTQTKAILKYLFLDLKRVGVNTYCGIFDPRTNYYPNARGGWMPVSGCTSISSRSGRSFPACSLFALSRSHSKEVAPPAEFGLLSVSSLASAIEGVHSLGQLPILSSSRCPRNPVLKSFPLFACNVTARKRKVFNTSE